MQRLPLRNLRQFQTNNFKQSIVNLYLRNGRQGFDIKQTLVVDLIQAKRSEEEHTHFEDRFINLTKILVDFRNRWYKEYLLQLGEHFKYKNEKG